MPTDPSQHESLAVLFADVSGSTKLYGSLGDVRARDSIARCLDLMTSQLAANHGKLIKTIGDEIMCVFPSAGDALRAACAMQEAVEKGAAADETKMAVRIGFHYGPVLRTVDDVFGDTVNIAARVAGIARAHQIVATQAAVDALPHGLEDKALNIWRTAVKGKDEEFDIFQIQWGDDGVSTRVVLPDVTKAPVVHADLLLSYGGQMLRVGTQQRSALLGRDASCHLVINDTLASRQHATVELRVDKFTLSDQSMNGTYIRFTDGQTARILHEDVLLRGAGQLSLGRAFGDNAAQIIEFQVPPERGAA